MFVALRDLRAARGRFLLIGSVVTLVALLVSFLSGLTAGLAHQNISAVEAIRADAVVFADTGAQPSFDASALTGAQIDAWRQAAGPDGTVDPIGISHGQAAVAGRAPAQVALFGAAGDTFGNRVATDPGTVVLSRGAPPRRWAHASAIPFPSAPAPSPSRRSAPTTGTATPRWSG